MPQHLSTPETFWSKVDMTGECWPYKGPCRRGGYAVCTYQKRQYRVHRLAYELTYGPIPAGVFICHSCDNRLCCNPEHLWLGTPAANSEDMVLKLRQHRPRGERNTNAKLTLAVVREMRRARRDEGLSIPAIASRFGVRYLHAYKIIRGLSWRE